MDVRHATQLILPALILTAYACGDSSTPEKAPAAPARQVASTVPSDAACEPSADIPELVLIHTYSGAAAAAVEESVAAFDRMRPDITVRIETVPFETVLDSLERDIPAGRGPDVFIAPDTFAREWMTRLNIVQPLDSLLRRAAPQNSPGDGTGAELISRVSADGHLYGVPLAYRVPVMISNTDLVKGDRLLRTAADDDRKRPVAFVGGDWLSTTGFLTAFGGQVVDGTGRPAFDSTGALTGISKFAALLQSGTLLPFDCRSAMVEQFNSGLLVAMMTWPDTASMISTSIPWTMTPLPAVAMDDDQPARQKPWWQIDAIFMTSWSRHRRESAELIAWLSSPTQVEFMVRRGFAGLITGSAERQADDSGILVERQIKTAFFASMPSTDLVSLPAAARWYASAMIALSQTPGAAPGKVEPFLKAAAAQARESVTKVMQSSSVRLK